jgi:hypothetical protein
MPTLDDIDIAVQQRDDPSHGVHILGMGAATSLGSADTATGSDKGKEKIALSELTPRASSDTEMSSEDTTPLVRRMRLACSDGSMTDMLLQCGRPRRCQRRRC